MDASNNNPGHLLTTVSQVAVMKIDNCSWWHDRSSVVISMIKPFRDHLRKKSEKATATHSSILAWRIPETADPGGLPSMGLHKVGHN